MLCCSVARHAPLHQRANSKSSIPCSASYGSQPHPPGVLCVCQVYKDAHKFHHFLHDATPFEAHFFGSGAPEEWAALATELLLLHYLGLPPLSTSFFVVLVEHANKSGHVRKAVPEGDENHHPDHHTTHNKNFADTLLDVLFRTRYPDPDYAPLLHGCEVVRRERGDDTLALCIQPRSPAKKAA